MTCLALSSLPLSSTSSTSFSPSAHSTLSFYVRIPQNPKRIQRFRLVLIRAALEYHRALDVKALSILQKHAAKKFPPVSQLTETTFRPLILDILCRAHHIHRNVSQPHFFGILEHLCLLPHRIASNCKPASSRTTSKLQALTSRLSPCP